MTLLTGALARALLVAVLVATPSLLLPQSSPDTHQVVALIAIFCAVFTFSEYSTSYPCLVEFRGAPPYNRIRFVGLMATVFILSVMARNPANPAGLTIFVEAIGLVLGHILDFPYSPVRLVLLSLPDTMSPEHVAEIRSAAGTAYMIGVICLVVFYLLLKINNWPNAAGAFNVWINLPTFDPTAGGDVVDRLNRDARLNIALGFLMPFMMPAVAKAATVLYGPIMLSSPHTMVWVVSAWVFLPLSLFMRGIAMGRVASMILEARRRSAAEVAPKDTPRAAYPV